MGKHMTAAEINDACETIFGRSADMMDLRIFDFARAIESMATIREREACSATCLKHADYLRNQWESNNDLALHAAGIEAQVLAHAILSRSNVKVSGPEAALSPEGRARLPGSAATEEQ